MILPWMWRCPSVSPWGGGQCTHLADGGFHTVHFGPWRYHGEYGRARDYWYSGSQMDDRRLIDTLRAN